MQAYPQKSDASWGVGTKVEVAATELQPELESPKMVLWVEVGIGASKLEPKLFLILRFLSGHLEKSV